MPGKRTGIIPLKKNFTEMGPHIGARNLAMHNKILSQAMPGRAPAINVVAAAPPAAPPPAPASALNNLFNISTFGKTIDGEKLELAHLNALIAASIRWNNFLSFHPELLNAIKKHKSDWKGFELLEIVYTDTGGIAAAGVIFFKEYLIIDTEIPHGFRLTINNALLKNGFWDTTTNTRHYFTQKNLQDVLAHELGHALGLVNTITPDYIYTIPSTTFTDPNGKPGTYYTPQMKCIIGGPHGQFPLTYKEYRDLISSAILSDKLLSASPYIMLDNRGTHWQQKMVSQTMHLWDPVKKEYPYTSNLIYYGNFINELMATTYNPLYKRDHLISNISLKYLTEIRVDGWRAYIEKTPGASEVASTIKIELANSSRKHPNFTYVLIGTAGSIVSKSKDINRVPMISVEKSLSYDAETDAFIDATDATDATTNDATYNVIYPEGYAGERNDDEILRIVANHEMMMNDPSYMAMTMKCCH